MYLLGFIIVRSLVKRIFLEEIILSFWYEVSRTCITFRGRGIFFGFTQTDRQKPRYTVPIIQPRTLRSYILPV